MKRIKKSIMRTGILAALIICGILSAGAFLRGSDSGSYIGKADGTYITVAHAAGETDADTLINFYKEKVDKLNTQCNVLLIICILLLVALIITRIIQPQQSIYEVEKSAKKKGSIKKKSDTPSGKTDRGDIFEDAVESSKPQEAYTVQKEVVEELRDIGDTLK